MSNVKPAGTAFKHPITAWFAKDDYDFLKKVAAENKVTVSAYMRAALIDVIADERERLSKAKTIHQGAIVYPSETGLG
jgi:hypothetical protein